MGSSDIDGTKLGELNRLSIDRHDDISRFTAGSGPAVAPYLNFWITDGAGKYAVLANEPSNGAFQPLYSDGYDLTFADLANQTAKVFEAPNGFALPTMTGSSYTFADFADYTIAPPNGVPEWTGLGSGAPIVLSGRSANESFGVNWVFGDSLANYLSGSSEGYVVANALVSSTVPEPSSFLIACFGLAVAGVGLRRRRAKSIQD
ncbi:PEP-CTERM sorting domain-containing protein [Allorhodopirellula solitaria]|uniref:PEP-CTERM sorting domain-containing protein n=1 Tax=Allorhodopirellula solitaria TaxID=2527987 RepID=UPI0016465B14|nr:PEP-CTERM sorting domain-containing protein [Allorhodopirellula solitaria]